MSRYQVVCTDKVATLTQPYHTHISHLGLATNSGTQLVTREWVIQELRKPYGHRFYTISPTTGAVADVIEAGCERCGVRPYVRTTADGIHDNNLNSLNACPVLA